MNESTFFGTKKNFPSLVTKHYYSLQCVMLQILHIPGIFWKHGLRVCVFISLLLLTCNYNEMKSMMNKIL